MLAAMGARFVAASASTMCRRRVAVGRFLRVAMMRAARLNPRRIDSNTRRIPVVARERVHRYPGSLLMPLRIFG